MALGATSRRVAGHVLRDSVHYVAIGVGLGLAGAVGVARAVQSMMFGVSAFDPMAFASAAALLTLIGLAAAWIPARRASAVDPAIALRSQ